MFINRGHSKHDDLDLIKRFKVDDDKTALGELFSRYSALIYGVCLKYLKDRDDAKDAVMQIFEKLNSSLKEHDIEHFKSWLYATSRNHCLMSLRTSKKIHKEELSDQFMETDHFLHLESETEMENDLNKLEKCIETLKTEQKDCVTLFYLKEMCYRKIVEATGIDLKKVKSHIQNGKRNLKLCMEEIG